MAKTKRLNVKQVESELWLIACGADGAPFEPDGEYTRSLAGMHLENLSRFACAIAAHYFPKDADANLFFLRMTCCECWESYATLAAEIVKERKRLDAKGEA